MNTQKRNKIIIIASLIILVIVISGTISYLHFFPLNLVIKQCENTLSRNTNGYSICKIVSRNNRIRLLKSDDELNSEIYPTARYIISLNLEKLLQNYNKSLVTNEPQSFCFAFYPVPVIKDGTFELSFDRIKLFYQSFEIKTLSSYKLMPKDDLIYNVICTQPDKKLQNISFFISLPNSDIFAPFALSHLSLMNSTAEENIPDFAKYGVKVLLANKEFMDNFYSKIEFRTNLGDNYGKMEPLLILQNRLNFTYYYK